MDVGRKIAQSLMIKKKLMGMEVDNGCGRYVQYKSNA